MSPIPTPSQTSASPSTTLSSTMPQESQTGLPGMKRGIAIGVACCVAVLLIALLAFFAVRRRKRTTRSPRKSEGNIVELAGVEVWPQEKTMHLTTPRPPSPPPVEADARMIYELDADQIPELPNRTDTGETNKNKTYARQSWCLDDDAAYTQKSQQRDTRSSVLSSLDEPDHRQGITPQLPLLTISAPGGSLGDVSPLLGSPWNASSRSASPVSALPDAHLPSHRYGQWER